MKTGLLLVLLLAALVTASTAETYSADHIVIGGLDGADPTDTGRSFPIALAVSGGGARGLATIGVLKAFEEAGISIRAIAGTSMGGIIGGLYAAGYSADELADIVQETDFRALFSSEPSRLQMFLTQRQDRDRHLLTFRFVNLRPVVPQALTQAQRLTALLTSLTNEAAYRAAGDFSRLPIPYKTVCTDILSGDEVVLDSGSLADAMRATVAFPLALSGLETDGQILMDGGIVNPIPVDIAQQMNDGSHYVVAINTATSLVSKDELRTPLDLAGQVTTIMTRDKQLQQIARADYLIEPDLVGFTTTDFKYKDSLIAIGYRAGSRAAHEIREHIQRRQDSNLVSISGVYGDGMTDALVAEARAWFDGRTMSQWQLEQKLKQLVSRHSLFRLEADLIRSTDGEASSLQLRTVPAPAIDDVSIYFENNSVIDDGSLAAFLVGDHDRFTADVIRHGLDSIVEEYHRRGVDLAFIQKVDFDYLHRRITITVDEAIIGDVRILDNHRTKGWFIRSHFPLDPGEPYSTKEATQGLSNIYGTDLFDRVSVDVVRDHGKATVQLRVAEKAYTQARVGWHWHDDYESEEFITLLDDNVFGAGVEAHAHARYSPDRRHYYAGLQTNRIWSTYLTAQLRFYHTRLIRQLYDGGGDVVGQRKENTDGIEFSLGQQIARLGAVRGGVAFEETETKLRPDGTTDKFNVRVITLESLVENFDRVPFPEHGSSYKLELRLAGKLFGGDIEYTRFFSSAETYVRLGSDVNYHPKASLGLSRSGLPPSEKFYLGGAHSFAGYNTYQLAGDKFFVISNELRFRLPLLLFLSLRWDFGNVYSETEDIKLSEVRHGLGAFLAIDSPIGPVEFGYGYTDDNPRIDEAYIHVGLDF